MGKTIRYNEYDFEDEVISRKEIKRIKKQQKLIRKEKEGFVNSGFEKITDNVEERSY